MGGLFGGGGTISHEESRINALRIQQSTYGAAIPIVFGTTRITGNFLDYDDFTAIPHTTTQSSGGKGGGGVTSQETTYTYTTAIVIGLCETNIEKVGQVWAGKQITTLSAKGLAMYQNQAWPYMQSKHPDKALKYKNTAYVAGVIDLGNSGEIPNLSFETFGLLQYGNGIIDALPSNVIRELLINQQFGIDFPAACIGDLSLYTTYCIANGWFISPAFTEQKECRENLADILQCTNSESVWSQGKLKIIPYGDEVVTGNGVTYTPPPAPLYDLDDSDFLPDDGEMPVVCKRSRSADAYNIQPFEFLNRNNGYNIETDDVKDAADIGINGPRPADAISMHFFCDKTAAKSSAQASLQRKLYSRNQYEFKLGWKYYLLEAMDIVTLTERHLGLIKEPVRIISIVEIDNQKLQIIAEECPAGIHGVTQYPFQEAERMQIDYNASPGNVNAPVVFEPPAEMVNAPEMWIGVSGSNRYWGGCSVWASSDGDTYKRMGRVTAPARHGVLAKELPLGLSHDITHPLAVDVSQSRAEMLSCSEQDFLQHRALCLVGNEIVAYQNATLAGAFQYRLSPLQRGVYGSAIQQHPANTQFLRLDDALYKYPFRTEDIGKTVYLKFTSFNVFGTTEQPLSDVAAYQYTINGNPLPVMVEYTITQSGSDLVATLAKNQSSMYTYELRYGSSWDNSALVQRFSASSYTFPAPGEGTLTFWLKAFDVKGNVSPKASKFIVNVTGLPKKNILFNRTENIDAWKVRHMFRTKAGWTIQETKLLKDYARFFDIFLPPHYLSDAAYAYLPTIDLGENIFDSECYYLGSDGFWRLKSVERLKDFPRFFDIFGGASKKLTYMKPKYALQTLMEVVVDYESKANVRVDVEYQVSFDNQNWSEWMPVLQKQFYGRFVNIRIHAISLDGITNTVIRGATLKIDVPDTEDLLINVPLPAEKTTVKFNKHFTVPPEVGAFVVDSTGKKVTDRITNITQESFDMELLDDNGQLIPGRIVQAFIRGY